MKLGKIVTDIMMIDEKPLKPKKKGYNRLADPYSGSYSYGAGGPEADKIHRERAREAERAEKRKK